MNLFESNEDGPLGILNSIDPMITSIDKKHWGRVIGSPLGMLAVLLSLFAGSLRADLIAPGATLGLEGTTHEQQPELGGGVLRDEILPFEIRDEEGTVILRGAVQDRVVRSSQRDTLIFGPKIINLELVEEREIWITGLAVEGYGTGDLDANYRTDALGDSGPGSATRSVDGNTLLFSHDPPNLSPSQRQYPLSVLSGAFDFELTGRITISAQTSFEGPPLLAVIEETAVPKGLEGEPEPENVPELSVQRNGDQFMVSWPRTAMLEMSHDLTNWEPVPEAVSPYVLRLDLERPRYVRLRYWPEIDDIDFDSLNEDHIDLVSPPLRPRWVPTKKHIRLVPERNIAGVFVLKFVEGSHVRLTTNGFAIDAESVTGDPEEMRRLNRALIPTVAEAKVQMQDIETMIKDFSVQHGFEVDFIFRPPGYRHNDLDPNADNEFIEKRKLEKLVSEELADLDLYYVVHAKNFSDRSTQEDFMNALQAFPLVEQVYGAAVAVLAAPSTPTKSVTSQQGYLNAAPGGVDAKYAWTKPGGKGKGVRVTDIEWDWVTDHEDFPAIGNMFYGGRPACVYHYGATEHGTAVMGVIASPHNGIGVDGISPEIEFGLGSTCRLIEYVWAALVATFDHQAGSDDWRGRSQNVVVANAINEARENMDAGDIMLIEQHTWADTDGRTCSSNCGQFGMIAMEYYPECFDAIRRAIAKGITVVEAAGNGRQNLDDPGYEGRFDPSTRHSGAIVVGASGAGNGRPASFTCHSKRLDVYSWGGGVVTIGYGDGSTDPFNKKEIPRYYTNDFGGTSSASAIIAGATASMQGMRLGAKRLALTPREMRELLHSTGTPQEATTISRPIGRQPNLKAAAKKSIGEKPKFLGGGDYVIRSKHSGLVLDVDLGILNLQGADNGRKLQQWSFRGSNNQIFRIFDLGQGVYVMAPLHSDKVLEIGNGSTATGAQAQQQDHTERSRHQMFRIEAVGDYYRIVNINSKKALSVRDGSHLNGATIEQRPIRNNDDEQLFRFNRVR